MKCSKFRAIKGVLGFLEASLVACFSTCFRIEGDEDQRKPRLSTNSIPSKNRDPHPLGSKNQFDAVLPCEEQGSPCGQAPRPSLQEDFDEDSISSDLERETQGDNSDFLKHKSGGCHSDDHQTSTKFVHCEENKHVSVVVSAVESNVKSIILHISPSKSDSKVAVLGSNDSPYPTPLNSSDEMQTPRTVYPNNQENIRTKKSSRICQMQYVSSVLKPVENLPHWNTLREDTSLSQSAKHPEQEKKIPCPDYSGRTQQISLIPAPTDSKLFESHRSSCPNDKTSQVQDTISREGSVQDKSLRSPTLLFSSGELLNLNVKTPNLVISSLSQWPKPPLPKDDTGNKWWDGNGIPNTTNKYKKDQKFSWHVTPFSIRLEKDLSDE